MKTRVRDFVAHQSLTWTTAVEASSGYVDLSSFFDPEYLTVVRDRSDHEVTADQLLVVTAGPQARLHGRLADALSTLERVPVGGHALVLLGWAATDLSGTEVAVGLASAGFEPVESSATPYPELPIAVLVVRVAPSGPVHVEESFEESVDDADDDGEVDDEADGATLAFQRSLAVASADWLADEVATMRARLSAHGAAADPVVRVAELTKERATLAASLRKSEADLKQARQKVTAMEASTSMRVGKALVRAAKNPRTATKLPRQAVRMWRLRGGRAGIAEARAKTTNAPDPAAVSAEVARLAAYRGATLEPRDRVSLLGVVRPETESVLRHHAFVTRAMPDDLMPLIDRADPDLVIIETAVSAPSSPWAYLGNPAASERERRLLGLVDAAQAIGRPVVLWRNTPVHETAALGDFAARCDLVVDSAPARSGGVAWSVGVSLADAVDLGVPRESRTAVLYAGGHDPRDTARRRATVVEALEAAGGDLVIRPRSGGPGVEGFPAELAARAGRPIRPGELAVAARNAAVVIASPFVVPDSTLGLRDDDLVALASGARLVSGPNRDLAAVRGLGSAVRVVEHGEVADAVRAAIADGPLTDAEHLAVLRTIFLEHTAPVRLRSLLARLGLDSDVDAARHVAVLVAPGTTVDPSALVESLLHQRHRPAEVVLAESDLPAPGALDELAATGVRVRTVGHCNATAADLARSVDAPWIATWAPGPVGPWSDTHLLDLLVGAEAGDADAVGLAATGGISGVDDLEGDAVLLRRSLVLADADEPLDLHRWSRRGRTLVAVGCGDNS